MFGDQKQFYERVLQMIRRYQMLHAGDRVIVGISGGIDSVVLLYVLYHLREHLEIDLYSAHLNHQFRGEEAERDAAFVRQFSEQLGIPCYVESQNVPEMIARQKLSPQDAARQVRYQFFQTLAQQLDAQKIATAHTADDQAETLLLGLLRGVGLHGLGGIQPILKNSIIRPFLTTSRVQIERFADENHLEYVVDSSNTNRKYLRNAVRLDLLPILKQQFNPSIVRRLTEYAQLFREDANFIRQIAAERYPHICKNVEGTVKINLDLFRNECITIQRELVYKIFEELTRARHLLERKHARAIVELFTGKSSGKQLSLPDGVVALRSYKEGILKKTSNMVSHTVVSPTSVVVPGKTAFGPWSIRTAVFDRLPAELSSSSDQQVWSQYVDYDRVPPPITVRYRRPGDVFQPLGMAGKKTLKKFFIDRKIPRDKRNNIPLFIDTNGIFWVVGYAIADRVKVSPETQNVLLCRVEKSR